MTSRRILLLGTSVLAAGLLVCGVSWNLYLVIAAGTLGLSAVAWIVTEDE